MSRGAVFGPFVGELECTRCPTCKSGSPAVCVFVCDEGIGYHRCEGCGLLFASPRFTESSLLRIYETAEFADLSPYRTWSLEMWRRRADRSYRTTDQKVELIKRFLPPAVNLLDVGCATGLFVLEANERGFRCEGVEPSSMLSAIARDVVKVPVATTQIEDFQPERAFDGIVLWDVLEHVYNPVRVLRACANLLVPGGMIFLQVPHADGMSFRLKSLLSGCGLKKPGYKHFGFPWHVYAFNRKSLSSMLQHCGFETVHFESWSHLLKDGRRSFPADVVIRVSRMFCLSDYIVCVARKRQEYAGS